MLVVKISVVLNKREIANVAGLSRPAVTDTVALIHNIGFVTLTTIDTAEVGCALVMTLGAGESENDGRTTAIWMCAGA